MDIPDVIVEWALGIASATGVGGFLFLKSKANKNADEIFKLKDHVNSECSLMDQKILGAIEKLGEKVTPLRHCEAKQELWQTRFDSLMVQNKEQHDHIGDSVNMALAGLGEKFEVVFDKMDSMQEYLNKIQAKDRC